MTHEDVAAETNPEADVTDDSEVVDDFVHLEDAAENGDCDLLVPFLNLA